MRIAKDRSPHTILPITLCLTRRLTTSSQCNLIGLAYHLWIGIIKNQGYIRIPDFYISLPIEKGSMSMYVTPQENFART